jgi:hypothetical protein
VGHAVVRFTGHAVQPDPIAHEPMVGRVVDRAEEQPEIGATGTVVERGDGRREAGVGPAVAAGEGADPMHRHGATPRRADRDAERPNVATPADGAGTART